MTENFDTVLAHEANNRVPDCLEELTSDYVCAELEKAYRYHFSVPGGRTRENLTLATAKHLGIRQTDSSILAEVVENLHNASLIQDDLQDNSTHRRGQATVARRFGADVAIGLVNLLITQSFSTISKLQTKTPLPLFIQCIQNAIVNSVHGQTSELVHRSSQKDFETRIDQATAKSGPLFALAIQLPLICAGEFDYIHQAKSASCQFGLAYQLIDDLKDFKLDELNSPGTNIFVELVKEKGQRDAVIIINNKVNNCLKSAAHLCSNFPFESGQPLIKLINKLEAQLDSFNG